MRKLIMILAMSAGLAAQAQDVQIHIGQTIRGSARVDVIRALQNYRVDFNSTLESIEVRGSSNRNQAQASLINNGRVESTAYFGGNGGNYGVFLYPSYQQRLYDYRSLSVEIRGEAYLESLVVRLNRYGNPYPPGPGHPIFQEVTCSSYKPLSATCSVNGYIQDVQLIRQISSDACTYGRSWWYDSSSITVTRGCRAKFRARLSR